MDDLVTRVEGNSPVENVLFVCAANICRSYTAERLFKAWVKGTDLKDVLAFSRGVWQGMNGRTPDPVVQEFLKSEGADYLTPHYSRAIKKQDIDLASLVLVMEPWHVEEILVMEPDAEGKTLLLGEFAAGEPQPLALKDPYGRGTPYYRSFFVLLDKSLTGLMEALRKARGALSPRS